MTFVSSTWNFSSSRTNCLRHSCPNKSILHQPFIRVNKTAKRNSLIRCSTRIPTHFNTIWYEETTTPLEVDIAVQYVQSPNNETPTDFHFIDKKHGIMGIIDYPLSCDDDKQSHQIDSNFPVGKQMIEHLKKSLTSNNPVCADMPVVDTHRILTTAMNRFGTPPGFSALLIDSSTKNMNMLRITRVGACGMVLIRDDKIIYRSYPNTAASLIDHLSPPLSLTSTPQQQQTNSSSSFPSTLQRFDVHSEFLELQPNDLVLAGTDGFFANLNDLQILGFVRPVPDHIDKTLALANSTCLASWTTDDVEFISYYLSNLATNFATARHSRSMLRYPFPPSPHLDDITVLCASWSFK